MANDNPVGTKIIGRPSSWWLTRWVGLGVRWARLAAFCTATLTVALLVSASRARGDVGEKMIILGRELLPMSDLLQETQHVRVNGESIYLASAVTAQSVHEVLDRYEAHCRAHTGGLEEEMDSIPAGAKATLASRFPAAWSERFGIVREEHEDEGMVVCIARSDGGGIRGFVERANLFLADGQLFHLGNLRYAYVRKTSAGQSHVLTTFTEGPFNIYRVLGTEKDTVRDELDGAPLPANAATPMTFRIDGMPYVVQAFASPDPPEKVAAYYLETLPRFGWEKVSGPGDLFSNIIMRRNGVTLFVTALQIEDGDKSNVVLTEGAATALTNAPR